MQVELCVFCQGTVDPASGRCQQCGRVQSAQTVSTPPSQAAQTIACPTCGTAMPLGARFCGNCRQELNTHVSATFVGSPGEPGGTLPRQDPTTRQEAPASIVSGPRPPQRSVAPKIVLFVFILILIAGATGVGLHVILQPHSSAKAGNQARGTVTINPGVTDTPTPTPAPISLLVGLNSPASADMNGMHIQTDGLGCTNQLVLKNPQATYDDTAIQQMQTYLAAFGKTTRYKFPPPPDGIFFYTPELASHLPPLPDTLQWVQGGTGCVGSLDFTPTGNEPIEIDSLGVTYDTDAQPNTFPYQLVDMCSVLGLQPNPGICACDGCGSGVPCVYQAPFTLQAGPAGTAVKVPITTNFDDEQCPLPLMLDPNQPVVQVVHLKPNSSLAQELYRVRLTVTITTAEGTQTLTLPASFTSSLAFATASQLSCYKLQGNTFTQEPVPNPFEDPTRYAFPCV